MSRTGVERKPTLRASLGRLAAAAVAVGALAAVAVAPSAAAAATQPASVSSISMTNNAKLGTILAAGNTVYTLKPSKTACAAACLKEWPPVLLAKGMTAAAAGTGVDATKLGTVAAAHRARQITYGGKKLYYYVDDKKPGQVHGNVTNKWGKWSTVALTAAIAPTTAPATTAPPATAAPAQTSPPDTAAPDTTPPATSPPETAPPATAAPQTSPPQTSPPQTSPPATNPPSSGGTAF